MSVGIMLLTAALALQFVLPISTSPENSAGSCGRLLESQQKEADDDRNLWVLLFEEQRLEAVCDDARTARWAYVGLSSGAILFGSVRLRRRTPHRTVRFILIGVGLLLALAAVTDGRSFSSCALRRERWYSLRQRLSRRSPPRRRPPRRGVFCRRPRAAQAVIPARVKSGGAPPLPSRQP